PSGTARVRTAPRSEPACGSVSTMVPVQSPRTICGREVWRCHGEPHSSRACTAPWVSIGHSLKDRLAEAQNSATAVLSTRGTPGPAVLGQRAERRPAAGHELLVGVAETGRGDDALGSPAHPLGVAGAVERVEHLLREAGGLLEHRLRDLVGIVRQLWSGAQPL